MYTLASMKLSNLTELDTKDVKFALLIVIYFTIPAFN